MKPASSCLPLWPGPTSIPTSLAAPPTLTASCAEIKISQPIRIWYDSHQMSHITIQPGKIVNKPWGYEIIWAHTDRYVGKILHINKGESLSYQYHVVKDETIRLLSGSLELEVELEGDRTKLKFKPGDCLHILPGMKHRMTGLEECDVLEV